MGDLPKQKTNKIIQDLQQMGAVNAQITMDEEGNIKFADELELADKPYQFATYDLSGKFTTPATSPVGSQTFNTWEDYMNALSEVKTSVVSPVKLKEISSGDAQVAENIFTQQQKEKEQKEQEIIENLKKEPEGKSYIDSQGDTYTSTGTGGMSFTPSAQSPVTYQTYQSQGMQQPVYTGPRAGVMAPKSNTTSTPAVNYEETYGADI